MVVSRSSFMFLPFFMALIINPSYSSSIPQNPSLPVSFNEAFVRVFGDQNVVFKDPKGYSVQISLDQTTGSGFISRNPYLYSLFSASIKLPSGNYTAGVVVTFYASNGAVYSSNHDELDFEFLGHRSSGKWVVQTNMYGNGSVATGREEKYDLPFDPTADFHVYSILWTETWIVFYVDGAAIREIKRVKGGDYPSKSMSLYGTIWDGSDWATDGGKFKTDFKYAPFVTEYSDFLLEGCHVDSLKSPPEMQVCDKAPDFIKSFSGLTMEERAKMEEFRKSYMSYSYCNDRKRYPIPLPECLA